MKTEDEGYAELGREVERLWQRAEQEGRSTAQLGSEVDKLLCWGTEAVREARRACAEWNRSG